MSRGSRAGKTLQHVKKINDSARAQHCGRMCIEVVAFRLLHFAELGRKHVHRGSKTIGALECGSLKKSWWGAFISVRPNRLSAFGRCGFGMPWGAPVCCWVDREKGCDQEAPTRHWEPSRILEYLAML